MVFGQLVIGPPGSGKTTYCHGMQQYLSALGRRVAIVNLDPANDVLPYTPEVDVAELVCLDTVMEELQLGPNGGEHLARLGSDIALSRADWHCCQEMHRSSGGQNAGYEVSLCVC